MKKKKEIKILIGKKVITRDTIFKNKERFKKKQAKMPFKEKIWALIKLQKIASSIKKDKDIIIWKI